ncbi:hypothetical protein SAMN05192533_11736 [Mesobacillus persicus]|uniref:DUF2281 domain-containing protein n=1 Tax=Mesobacillus persicus TaxID=930146 RepID=A0A1H8IET8_9BACI|nr:hypothetical protein [Mesobacillus persicus]SEN67370.1 hypothetical protein SAMN05192533_11736 [Mesobacillus persicus]
MSVDREELKRMIDQIPEQDALEVYDFIEYLNMKRKKDTINEMEVEYLAKDEGLIRQVQKSCEDRRNGRIYSKGQGLEYFRKSFEES